MHYTLPNTYITGLARCKREKMGEGPAGVQSHVHVLRTVYRQWGHIHIRQGVLKIAGTPQRVPTADGTPSAILYFLVEMII